MVTFLSYTHRKPKDAKPHRQIRFVKHEKCTHVHHVQNINRIRIKLQDLKMTVCTASGRPVANAQDAAGGTLVTWTLVCTCWPAI